MTVVTRKAAKISGEPELSACRIDDEYERMVAFDRMLQVPDDCLALRLMDWQAWAVEMGSLCGVSDYEAMDLLGEYYDDE